MWNWRSWPQSHLIHSESTTLLNMNCRTPRYDHTDSHLFKMFAYSWVLNTFSIQVRDLHRSRPKPETSVETSQSEQLLPEQAWATPRISEWRPAALSDLREYWVTYTVAKTRALTAPQGAIFWVLDLLAPGKLITKPQLHQPRKEWVDKVRTHSTPQRATEHQQSSGPTTARLEHQNIDKTEEFA